MSSPVVAPGQSPPFEVVDDSHHGALVIITGAICLSISLVCLLIRLYVRLMLSPPFAHDDYVLLGAIAVAVIQSSIVFYAASIGFGTATSLLSSDEVYQIQRTLVASDVLYLMTIYLAKCCVVAIFLRLTPQRSYRIVSWVTLGICSSWVAASILIITINCELNQPWADVAAQCSNLFGRWEFITILNVATEAFLFALSLVMVNGLQSAIGRKAIILSAFASRLPLIAFTVLRLYYLYFSINSLNPSFDAINPYIWTQVELNYSLVSCTIFCLRPFMMAVRTNYGTAGDASIAGSKSNSRAFPYATGSTARSRATGQSYTLRSIASALKKEKAPSLASERSQPGDDLKAVTRPGVKTMISSNVPHKSPSRRSRYLPGQHDGRSSVGSDGSTKMIIRKDVEYTVQHHHVREANSEDSGKNSVTGQPEGSS